MVFTLLVVATPMPKYLIQQRRVWYAVLEIPKALRPKIGKARFKETLQTESRTIAEQRVHAKISQWKNLIAILRDGGDELEHRLAEWRLLMDHHKAEGMSKAEIRDLSADVSATLATDEPILLDVHSIAFGSDALLAENIDYWTASLKTADKTKDMNRSDVARFAKTFKRASEASNKAVAAWVEGDLIEAQGLSEATCRRIISSCRGYWIWLQRKRDLAIPSPFEGVVPKKSSSKQKSKKRKPFSRTDFQSLLSNCPDTDTALGDLIMLGGYTGARIEELCSLKLEDVSGDRLTVKDAKTDAGWREIPIHSEISELVATLKRNSTDGYLLSGLTANKYGDRSNAIGKRFGRLKTRLGYGGECVFHSLRKLMATSLENAGVQESVAARILGHELGTMSYGLYSGGLDFRVLKDAIEKVDLSNRPRAI